MTLAAAGGPGWTDILTAIGTVGAVIAAVGIALWTEWRSGRRIKAEQERSARQLAEERERTTAALEEERAYSRAQFEEERTRDVRRQQIAEAYAVQVAFGERDPGTGPPDTQGRAAPSEVRQLAVMVVNRGSSTITRLEAQFCLGSSMISHARYHRETGFQKVPEPLRSGYYSSREQAVLGVLTPFDAGIRFETDEIHIRNLSGPFPIVRWTDRWGTRWEHKRGVVRRIREDEPWEP